MSNGFKAFIELFLVIIAGALTYKFIDYLFPGLLSGLLS